MNCIECSDRLTEYLDGSLSVSEQREITLHMDSCGDCRERLEALRATITILGDMNELDVPSEVAAALRTIAGDATIAPNGRRRAKTSRSDIQRAWFTKPAYRSLIAVAAVAVIALMFGASQLLNLGGSQPQVAMMTAERQASPMDSAATGAEESTRYDAKASSDADKTKQPEDAVALQEPGLTQSAPAQGTEDMQLKAATNEAVNPTEKSFPIVTVSATDYNKDSATELLRRIKTMSDGAYTVEDATKKQSAIIKEVQDKIGKRGGKGAAIKNPLEAILKETKRAALPVYLEKAKYNGQDAWLIVIRWSLGGAKNPLQKASLYVTDLSGWKTLDYVKDSAD